MLKNYSIKKMDFKTESFFGYNNIISSERKTGDFFIFLLGCVTSSNPL